MDWKHLLFFACYLCNRFFTCCEDNVLSITRLGRIALPDTIELVNYSSIVLNDSTHQDTSSIKIPFPDSNIPHHV